MLTLAAALAVSATEPDENAAAVAALDTYFQAAVKANDWKTMDAILDDRMILVLGSGVVLTKAEQIAEAKLGHMEFEQQDEEPGTQTVRMFGDTAVVTAKLWIKGADKGRAFDRTLWFSDTYVRTASGWRYAFGQASLALPSAQS